MSTTTFRIHPSIGFARVGTAKEFYLAPETLAGHPLGDGPKTGGLPIKAGTEDTEITSSDVRGPDGGLARQAARFRIYAYQAEGKENYPMGQAGAEIRIGSTVEIGGQTKTVADIIWTVHMANKKTAWYGSADDDGILAWGTPADPKTPTEGLRNPELGSGANDPKRWAGMFIDPGPRAISGANADVVDLGESSPASYYQAGAGITPLPSYPTVFPKRAVASYPEVFGPSDDYDGKLYPPGVAAIQSLGELQTDEHGRLVVVAAWGHANSFNKHPAQHGFVGAVNNDWWFDDTGDGPVDAVLVFKDGSTHTVEGAAWVISTDPAYAPQVLNVVSLWDDIHDSWVRKLDLRPDLFANGEFQPDYRPSFEDEVRPIFLAAGLQRWVTNLTTKGISAHEHVERITADTKVSATALAGLGLIRKPVEPGEPAPDPTGDRKRMPLSLGDAGRSLLSLAKTQYQYLTYWNDGHADASARVTLNHGETLDKASFLAGLGGRFGPGIDMTYICREPDMWRQDWRSSGGGPFRVRPKPLDYSGQLQAPFLSLGWTPKRDETELEPGDVSKFMAIPWHADYNSCGTHLPSPNIEQNNQLYWSWPAQRPLTVYAAKDVRDGAGLVEVTKRDANGNPIKTRERQRYSMRGPFTKTAPINPSDPPPFGPGNPAEVGRYQKTPKGQASTDAGVARILDHWMNIGVIIQASNIDDGGTYDPAHYLEVESRLDDEPSDAVQPWDKDRVPPGQFNA
ncbi:Lysine-epsilon oxidase [Enhygromyxa salina]|uniref:Lysine-epsilon oxidase n=1 Tax=Enhygromyxa salina TaxID=215803 RepID=A0A0C2CWB2_9BACT|nr:LodA/GoxA family CTQ-dependent oxidase [Enhygromyxa salina]KIG12147.1 Lysine-epsilon oxidase [Enhygromyxa salina]